jgi:hypothetical protein
MVKCTNCILHEKCFGGANDEGKCGFYKRPWWKIWVKKGILQ